MTMHSDGLTKLIEECGELIQIAAKKQAYLYTDEHPDGAGSMKVRLEEEAADVLAAITFIIRTQSLNGEHIRTRAAKKLARFTMWHSNKTV